VAREVVADDLRLLAHQLQRAAIALRKPAAEFVDDGLGIQIDEARVLTDVGACKQAGGPPREVVVLQAVPELDGHLRLPCNRVERDAALDADPAEIRPESFPRAHDGRTDFAKTLPGRTGALPMRRRQPCAVF